jgi:putative protein-disulfide isomerase
MKKGKACLVAIGIFALAMAFLSPLAPAKSQPNMKIIYIYDAYCGWCYGFSPVIRKFYEKHQHEMAFEAWSGGLILGERIGPMDPGLVKYIREVTPRLEATTGVTVSKAYLEALSDPARVNDSNIPARAMHAFRKQLPHRSIEFASFLQQASFGRAADLSKKAVYEEAEAHFGLPEGSISLAMDSLQATADAEFAQVNAWGIRGFPAVILDRGDTLIALSNGYTDEASLEKALEHALKLEVRK